MTKKQILTSLIDYYKECIKNLPYFGVQDYLDTKAIRAGICYCALEIFDINIYGEYYTNIGSKYKAKNLSNYWYKIPQDCFFRFRIKQCLQYRVNKMEEILKNDES